MVSRMSHVFPIRAVGPDMCLVGKDRFSSVCEAVPINFGLRSQKDQERLVLAYNTFLNGLNFPVEILVRSDILRLDDYLAELKIHEDDMEPHLRPSLGDYIEFVKETATLQHLVRRRFFIILSWQGADSRSRPLKRGEVLWDEAEMELGRRKEMVEAGLRPLGIRIRTLSTGDLYRFLYASLGGGRALPAGASWAWREA